MAFTQNMSFDSLSFILFFPIVVILFYVFPCKYRQLWLVIASYYFYTCWDVKYAFVLFGITYITYISARMLSGHKRKIILAACVIVNLLLFGSFKYSAFIINSINSVLKLINVQIVEANFSIIVPLGISFYTLQALGYVIDVYRGKIKAEANFINYALYVSFFPTIVSGPIERSGNLLKQIQVGTNFSYERIKKGLLRMSYGYFEKLLIANNISRMTNNAYENYLSAPGEN